MRAPLSLAVRPRTRYCYWDTRDGSSAVLATVPHFRKHAAKARREPSTGRFGAMCDTVVVPCSWHHDPRPHHLTDECQSTVLDFIWPGKSYTQMHNHRPEATNNIELVMDTEPSVGVSRNAGTLGRVVTHQSVVEGVFRQGGERAAVAPKRCLVLLVRSGASSGFSMGP